MNNSTAIVAERTHAHAQRTERVCERHAHQQLCFHFDILAESGARIAVTDTFLVRQTEITIDTVV